MTLARLERQVISLFIIGPSARYLFKTVFMIHIVYYYIKVTYETRNRLHKVFVDQYLYQIFAENPS